MEFSVRYGALHAGFILCPLLVTCFNIFFQLRCSFTQSQSFRFSRLAGHNYLHRLRLGMVIRIVHTVI